MSTSLSSFIVSALLVLAACSALAQPAQSAGADERELERGAMPDTTPQQKYRTAINEAGGGYKVYLAECAAMAAAERRACRRDATNVYNREMAAARTILKTK